MRIRKTTTSSSPAATKISQQICILIMACSKFEYVKAYELATLLLPNTYIVVRIDGRAFTKFCQLHELAKPNDDRLISLMTEAACCTVKEFTQILIAYGQSDEYSFAFKRKSALFKRRSQKINSTIVSYFTSAFLFNWHKHFKQPLLCPVSFDSRVVCYPTEIQLKDYFRWRQADCHINNLYNTCFWLLVSQGCTHTEAEQTLLPTNSAAKNELLFRSGINYNNIEQVYRKGTVVKTQQVEGKRKIVEGHWDLFKDQFWQSIFEYEQRDRSKQNKQRTQGKSKSKGKVVQQLQQKQAESGQVQARREVPVAEQTSE